MNYRPIKGHVNLETLKKVVDSFGDMSDADLEQQLHWIASGIRAAKGKITRAQDEMKATKYLIRRRNTLPEGVVKMALKNRAQAQHDLTTAIMEKAQFIERYRNFRSISYIRKSLELITQPE